VAKDLVELAYELSLRNLGQQEAALNELRARTGTVLTASAASLLSWEPPRLRGRVTGGAGIWLLKLGVS
jgi:hypothetical protein